MARKSNFRGIIGCVVIFFTFCWIMWSPSNEDHTEEIIRTATSRQGGEAQYNARTLKPQSIQFTPPTEQLSFIANVVDTEDPRAISSNSGIAAMQTPMQVTIDDETTTAPTSTPTPPVVETPPTTTESPPSPSTSTASPTPTFPANSTEDLQQRHRNAINQLKVSGKALIQKIKVWPAIPINKEGKLPTVTCMTHTYKPNHHRAQMMQTEWGHQCNRHFIYTNSLEPSIRMTNGQVIDMGDLPGGYGYGNIWNKVRHMWKDMDRRGELVDGGVNTSDFYLLAGDDVLVIMENLQRYVASKDVWAQHSARKPLLLGHRMTTPDGVHFLSGAGYLLNDVAARLLVSVLEDPKCSPTLTTFAEDVMTSQCLAAFGCPPQDSMDEYGEDRIAAVSPDALAEQTRNPKYMWWWTPWHRHRAKPAPQGNDALSVEAFLLHYMSGSDLLDTHDQIRYGNANAAKVETNINKTCGWATEGEKITLQCPQGSVIKQIRYAKYGTISARVSCVALHTTKLESFDACAKEVVGDLEAKCVGKNECTVDAMSGMFGGDPCPNVRKKLMALYSC